MASLIRAAAIVASAIVIFSFLAFATEEAGQGSQGQVNALGKALDDPAPAADIEREREREHGAMREHLDDANDVLLKPFTGITTSRNRWVERIVPGLLGLLAYGVGLTLLANFLPRKTQRSRDWRTAGSEAQR
jgi:hypothetical protein